MLGMCLEPPPTNARAGISGRFTGWPEQALDLLLELDGEPPVSVRESLREERERLIRQPMLALMQDLAHIDAAYSDFHVPGFRRTLGSWQRQVSFLRAERNIDQRVWLDLDGLFVQGAGWYFDPGSRISPGREGFLEAVVDDTTGVQLVRILERLRSQGFDIAGDVMKQIPRGYPDGHPHADLLRNASHPRARLLRHRKIIASRALGSGAWLHTPEALDRVLTAFNQLRTLTTWFADHVPAVPESP